MIMVGERLEFEIGCGEAETFWPGFLRQLPRRGLCGVPSVIFDYHQESETAFHRIAGHFVATLQSDLLAPSLGSGRQGRANGKRKPGSHRFRLSAASLGSTAVKEDRRGIGKRIFQDFPTAGHGRIGGFASLLFFECLPAIISSAHTIEGLNSEINRRRPLDIVHRESVVFRLVGAGLLEQNDEWAVARSGLILGDPVNVGDAEKPDSEPV